MRVSDCVANMRIFANVLSSFAIVFVLTTANVVSNFSIQEEGNACFDMAASIPGLQNLTGNHSGDSSTQVVRLIY